MLHVIYGVYNYICYEMLLTYMLSTISDWWLTNPLKNKTSSVGMMTFPTELEKIMFQSTNQLVMVNG